MWWIALAFVLLLAGCGRLVFGAGSDSYGTVFDDVPTSSECVDETGRRCLDSDAVRARHGLDRLAASGLTGKGVTVAVIDFSGADSFADDLEEYSSRMGLPPPRVRVRDVELGYQPYQEYDSSRPGLVRSAVHTTRQLQTIHSYAPQARLLVERLRFPEEEDVSRPLDELLAIRLRTLVNEGAADVVLLSRGVAEQALSERTEQASDVLRNRRTVFDDAARAGVTVVAAGGSRASWPSVDPGALSVGGQPSASRVFGRPEYQVNLSAPRKDDTEGRAVPDVTLPSDKDRHLIYQSVADRSGWMPVRATQAERFAGVTALAAQAAGSGLGEINDDIYYLASQRADPERNGLQAPKPEPGTNGQRTVVDIGRFVRALGDSARRSERAVPDERPKPEKHCRQGNSVDVTISEQQNVEVTPRICLLHDPLEEQLTGRITVNWEPSQGSDNEADTPQGRFDGFEVRTVLERGERVQQGQKCSIQREMNRSAEGSKACKVTIDQPDAGAWSTDGRLIWDRGDRPGGSESERKLRGTSPYQVE